MNPTAAHCEEMLYAAYSDQADLYVQASTFAAELCSSCVDGHNRTELIQAIAGLLNQVSEIDKHIAHAKQKWRDSNIAPGARLANVFKRLEELIRGLADRVRQAEGLMNAHKSRLAPEFEAIIRSHHMQRAYGMNR